MFSIKETLLKIKSNPQVSAALTYAKENPADIILGVMAVTMIGIDDSLDNIEEMEEIQTIIDVNNYRG